jgi:cytochrome c
MTVRPPSIPMLLAATGLLLVVVVAIALLARGHVHPAPPAWQIPGSDADRGRDAIVAYGCGSCHEIQGLRSARGRVGPRLAGFVDQTFIAGRLPNTPENLVLWIRHPQHVDPHNAMPDLGVSEQEARDIAAFLYSQR